MVMKYLESCVALELDEVIQEENKQIELEYYLVEREEYSNQNSVGKKYGIEIVKKSIAGNDRMKLESEYISDVSYCREDAKRILDILARNSVTPVVLAFVMDDIIGV